GRIVSKLFCAICWSNSTRLLNTPIAGVTAKRVDSSWIDRLAGLLLAGMRKRPPDFCASAGPGASIPTNSAPAAANGNSLRLNCASQLWSRVGCVPFLRLTVSLFIQPHILHPPAVIDAVGHLGVALDPVLPAARAGRVDQHRAEHRLRQLAFGLPDQ